MAPSSYKFLILCTDEKCIFKHKLDEMRLKNKGRMKNYPIKKHPVLYLIEGQFNVMFEEFKSKTCRYEKIITLNFSSTKLRLLIELSES